MDVEVGVAKSGINAGFGLSVIEKRIAAGDERLDLVLVVLGEEARDEVGREDSGVAVGRPGPSHVPAFRTYPHKTIKKALTAETDVDTSTPIGLAACPPENISMSLGIIAGFQCKGILVNKQKFTKTANIWGIHNNAKGTNTNRVVMFLKE